ncbi:MAG: SulP family inorganic anion transporter [Hyphomicrobiaceae bacterium]
MDLEQSETRPAPRSPGIAPVPSRATGVLRDLSSGLISALITIAYCISFGALLFQGELQDGLSLGISALLAGSAVAGLIVALTTSLSPASAGPDTPAVAVMSVLAASVAGRIAYAGGSVDQAIEHVLLAVSLATLMTGGVLYAIGAFRLGQLLRFIPYPVIGGFLAASGWLLLTGAIEAVTGTELTLSTVGQVLSVENAGKLLVAALFAVLLLVVRQRTNSYFALPLALFAGAVLLNLLLPYLAGRQLPTWYLAGQGQIGFWWPVGQLAGGDIAWGVFLRSMAELGAVAGVTAIALLLDVSSLEVSRAKAADIDREFRVNGIANVAAAVLGGVASNLSLQSSVLIEEAGGVSRLAGVFAALVIAAVLLSGIDAAGFVPVPLLAGLLAFLGVLMLAQTLMRAPAQRSVTELSLALVIMLVILWFGYLVGVVLGIVGACLMFAFSYSRIGVVRRHLTRAEFQSNLERSSEEKTLLSEEGGRIHLFWLSGFVFFGSSNSVFEEIRRAIDGQQQPPIRMIILDLGGVTGFDTSAILSLVKLRNYCREHSVELVIAAPSERVQRTLEGSQYFQGAARLRIFPTRNEALEWCEDTILDERSLGPGDRANFEAWIAKAFQAEDAAERIVAYFDRREIPAGTTIFAQGAAPDTIELVAAGRLAVTVTDDSGRSIRIRSMAGQTVVGEMGFFRSLPRAALVVAEEDVVLYTLTRANMQEMIKQEPELAFAFLQFIIRTLADRVEFANREISALV